MREIAFKVVGQIWCKKEIWMTDNKYLNSLVVIDNKNWLNATL